MQNFSIEQAKEKSANIVKNIYGVNNDNDLITIYTEALLTAFIHSQNNENLKTIESTNINNKTGIELDNEGDKYNVIRQQATQSEGVVIFNISNILAQIDIGTSFVGNNNTYNATGTTIGESLTFGNGTQDFLITKIETFASTKTAIIYCENQGLSNNIEIIGSGFGVAGLNGNQTITEFDKNSFRFANDNIVATTTLTSFTNTELFTANIIKTNIRSVETGAITNISRGGAIEVTTPLQYINSTGYIDYNEIGIGANLETDDNYRARIVAKKTSIGTIAGIENIVFNQSGVTRVALVQKKPFVGKFTIYFLRDNDSDIVPTQQELDAIKNILTNDSNLHPTITIDNVFVLAPTQILRRFTITNLLPNTARMQEAVKAKLQEIIYNNGIQDGTIITKTVNELKTLLIQNTQDSFGNIITNLDTITITDTLNAPATLALNVGEFLSVDTINFA